MKKFRAPAAAIAFLIISVLFIANHQKFHFFIPSQQVELSHGVEYGAVLKGFLFVQEITMQKRYLSRLDLYMAKLPSMYPNENFFLLLDEQHRILFTKRFSSNDFGEALYFPFDLKKNFDVGKGKKIYACVYSVDGDQGSYIGLAKKDNSNLGKLYVVSIVNNDIVQSFENQQSLVDFKGSIGARTYESDSKFFSLLQIILYILAAVFAILISYSSKVASVIRRSRIIPENAFLGFSLVSGLVMLVVTPPFMVPDEPSHFYRSYQVAELNFFKIRDEVPKSLVELSAICDRMKYSTHEKTTFREILSLADIRLDPGRRTQVQTQIYTVPYIPQAAGIVIGKLMHLNPLWLLYLGRMFNLLVSVLLVYLAIRTTPIIKWLFFLIGIMPMTLYQFSSLSYDALTISLSLLLIAVILNFALNPENRIGRRGLFILFLVSGLLAASKPPYFIIVFSFLIIPVARIGSRKKYAVLFIALVSLVMVISQLWAPGRKLFEKLVVADDNVPKTGALFLAEESNPPDMLSLHNPLSAVLPLMPHTTSGDQVPAVRVDSVSPYDPSAQKQYILDDPLRYIGIIFNTLPKSMELYAGSFVGLFGWVDSPLPNFLSYLYLFVLVFVAFGSTAPGVQISFVRKCILLTVFIANFLLIETAMYLYCNPVGSDSIIAVQGRYFIAVAPLLFILFVNRTGIGFIIKGFAPSPRKSTGKKQMNKQIPDTEPSGEMLLTRAVPWIAMLCAMITLLYSFFVIIERFYVIST